MRWIACAVALLAADLATVRAQGVAADARQAAATPTSRAVGRADRRFVEEAARAAAAQLQASVLALQRATDDDVRRFAQRMVDDHSKANAELKRIARAQGMAATPNRPSAAQQADLRALRMAHGDAFRRLYAQTFGRQAHLASIDVFNREVTEGRNPALRAYAKENLLTLQDHFDMAQSLVASTVGVAARSMPVRTGRVDGTPLLGTMSEVSDAVQLVQRMKRDGGMAAALTDARGVVLLPHYARGALGVGARGGSGVFLARQGDGFSNPVFYDLAGVSTGVQAGAVGGGIALLLMSDRAVSDFLSGRQFSIRLGSALSIGEWSGHAVRSAGKVQDIVVWSDTAGAYVGASLGVSTLTLDDDANRAYYGSSSQLSPRRIVGGVVENPRVNVLDHVLSV